MLFIFSDLRVLLWQCVFLYILVYSVINICTFVPIACCVAVSSEIQHFHFGGECLKISDMKREVKEQGI